MNPHWNLCVSSLFTHAGPSQPPCAACSSWDHRDMMWIRPLDRCPCNKRQRFPSVSDHNGTPAHMRKSQCKSVRAQRASWPCCFPEPILTKSCLRLRVRIWVSGGLRVRDHQNCWFPGAAGEGCSLFIVSCLSFMAPTERKGCGSGRVIHVLPPWSGADLSQNTDEKKKPHNLALMRAHSRGGNKSPQTSRFECVR